MAEAVKLAPKLDLSSASDLTATLRALEGKDVVLDMTEVKHLGSLCLQVMLSAATSAVEKGCKFSIVNASDRVIDQMRVMGMTPEAVTRGCQ
jgi:chemotaxis protein CheX